MMKLGSAKFPEGAWRIGDGKWDGNVVRPLCQGLRPYRRRSTMSVSAPATSANSTIGNEAAACTSDTITGEWDRSVITQPEATPLIQVPILEPSAASQKARNTGMLRGPQALAAGAGEALFRRVQSHSSQISSSWRYVAVFRRRAVRILQVARIKLFPWSTKRRKQHSSQNAVVR